MSIGSAKIVSNLARGLRFEDNRLIVVFRDGREVHVPLRLYPTLQKASSSERQAWEMIGPGKAFHWQQLDLDLSVDGLIQGLRQAIVPPPARMKSAVRSRRSA